MPAATVRAGEGHGPQSPGPTGETRPKPPEPPEKIREKRIFQQRFAVAERPKGQASDSGGAGQLAFPGVGARFP